MGATERDSISKLGDGGKYILYGALHPLKFNVVKSLGLQPASHLMVGKNCSIRSISKLLNLDLEALASLSLRLDHPLSHLNSGLSNLQTAFVFRDLISRPSVNPEASIRLEWK